MVATLRLSVTAATAAISPTSDRGKLALAFASRSEEDGGGELCVFVDHGVDLAGREADLAAGMQVPDDRS